MYNTYGVEETPNVEGLLAGLGVAAIIGVVILGILVLAVLALVIVSNCKIFKKAGEDWWKAIIPLYNSWIETKITGLAWWWFLIFAGLSALLSSVPKGNPIIAVGLVLTSFNYNYNLAKKFGKTNGFAVLNTFLPIVGLPILAFGSAKYNKSAKVDKNGIFSIEK